jgi:FixJ family two-component response regulator
VNPSRILLIEDDASLLVSLEQLLKASGFSVESFSSGRAALQHIQTAAEVDDPKTLVLIDVHLNGESGIEVQKAARALGIQLPFVFMSAHRNAREVNQAWLDGALNFLFKPFTPSELLQAIEKALDTHQELHAASDEPAIAQDVLEKFNRLTPRQKEVLKLVASGLSNTAISAQMAISARTVKMHRESMMHRFGFTHVADLVRFHDACKHLL